MIVITGATGYLGSHVLDLLLEGGMPTRELAVAVRNEEKARPVAERGVEVRYADYHEPQSLPPTFAGADVLWFVSGSSRDDDYKKLLAKTMEMPEQAAEAFTSMNRAIEEGRMSYISDDIELLTGAPPMTLKAFLRTTNLAV